MNEEMKYVRLGDLVELKQGLAINAHTNHLVSKNETNLHLLRIADMINDSKVVFMDEATPKRYVAEEKDIIYTRTGQVGLVFRHQSGVVHNNCFRVIPIDERKLNRDYLYWALQLKSVYQMANRYAAGAAQPDLPHTSFKKIKIPLYPIETQRTIAYYLNTFSSIIDNNNNRVKILEQLIDNLFKEWFIRFRFPGHETYSFVTGIPSNWEIVPLGDIILERPKSKVKVSDVEDCTGPYPFYTSGRSILRCDNYLVDGDNIYLNTGGVADVKYYSGKAHYSTDTWCIYGKGSYTLFLYMFLKDILPEINSSFFEGAALKHLKKTGLKKRKLLLPPETIVSEFNQVVSVIFKELLSLKKASANLTLQRDMLLSRLVNENFWVKQ